MPDLDLDQVQPPVAKIDLRGVVCFHLRRLEDKLVHHIEHCPVCSLHFKVQEGKN